MAVTMVFDVKGKIVDACMFLKGELYTQRLQFIP